MIRRLPIACLALVAVAAASGCTTFSNNDAVAKVGDETLTRDELADLIPAAPSDPASGSTPTTTAAGDDGNTVEGDTARGSIQLWALGRLITDEVVGNGGEITDEERAAAEESLASVPEYTSGSESIQRMFVDVQAAYVAWGAQLGDRPLPADELRARYELGTEESGLVCSSHILVPTEQEAREVLDAVEGGEAFADVARERSDDTASGENGGALGCFATAQFQQQFVPEFVGAALAATIGEPTEPVQSQFGWHVIRLLPFDEAGDELAQLSTDPGFRLPILIEEADVYVDPRFGTFTADGVMALGGSPADPGL